jgi:hypothetical protein
MKKTVVICFYDYNYVYKMSTSILFFFKNPIYFEKYHQRGKKYRFM